MIRNHSQKSLEEFRGNQNFVSLAGARDHGEYEYTTEADYYEYLPSKRVC